MRIFFNPNMRFFLDTIYCYDAHRGRGIATNLSEIADYLLQGFQGYRIRGVYKPGQLSTDRDKNIIRDKEELERRADAFYCSTGYTKIEYEDYKAHPEKYPGIDEINDFELGEEVARTIVVKDVKPKKKHPFRVINGVLVNENVLKKEKGTEYIEK